MTLYDKTYCARSVDNKCEYTECVRNLNGFDGNYICISNDFVCNEELKYSNSRELQNEN